jgi:hypothetical protein
MPDADVEICYPDSLDGISRSACLLFAAKGKNWRNGVDTAIFDAILTLLPMNSVLNFTAQNRTRVSKEFWLRHAPRWPLIEQARLAPTSLGAFREMLAEDAPPEGPRLPSLTRLILLNVTLTTSRAYRLGDMLIKRVEQGVPLEVLDLRTCVAADHATRFLAEIVVDVQEPLDARQTAMDEFFEYVGIRYRDKGDCDDRRQEPSYGALGMDDWYDALESESEDEDEDESEDDDEDESEDDDEDEMEHDDQFDYDDESENELYGG